MKTGTFWEVWEGKRKDARNEMSRPRHEDFRSQKEAEEYAREINYGWVKKLMVALDEDDIPDEDEFYREQFYRVKPSVVTAHVRCCRCGEEQNFDSGVLAYDWQFEHELMHGPAGPYAGRSLPCVEAWETDVIYPSEIFPLRKRVATEKGSIFVPITETLKPQISVMSSGEDED